MRNLGIIFLTIILLAAGATAAESTAAIDTILAKHRASLGSDKAVAGVRTRVAEGTSRYEMLSGGAALLEGKATIVSEGSNARYIMKFNHPEYRGEDLLTNGSKVQVYGMPKRSTLGELLYVHDALLKNGILTGALSTAWPLLDPKLRGGKLEYGGRKTIDDSQLDELTFVPSKRSDLQMKLYFEPASGRHVLTIATLTIEPRFVGGEGAPIIGQAPSGASAETMNAKQQAVRYRIEQRFSDFREFDGLTLPTNCSTLLIADGYRSVQLRYNSKFENIQHNLELDPKNFQLK